MSLNISRRHSRKCALSTLPGGGAVRSDKLNLVGEIKFVVDRGRKIYFLSLSFLDKYDTFCSGFSLCQGCNVLTWQQEVQIFVSLYFFYRWIAETVTHSSKKIVLNVWNRMIIEYVYERSLHLRLCPPCEYSCCALRITVRTASANMSFTGLDAHCKEEGSKMHNVTCYEDVCSSNVMINKFIRDFFTKNITNIFYKYILYVVYNTPIN